MSEEVKEILNKLSNRKQETLLQGIRDCQLKNIEHVFITREEYIDKVLNYINDLQQENTQLKGVLEEIREYINKCNFDNAEILYDFGSEYCYIDDFKEHILGIIDKGTGEDNG